MNITVPLWLAFAVFVGVIALTSVQERLAGQYELTRCGRFRFAVVRRWYGPGAQVRLRAEAGAIDADRYVVLQWETEDVAVPWLKVHKLNPETLTYWDEDAEAFWGPVTVFAPFAVRRFRPHLIRCVVAGRVVMLPWLTKYPVLPLSARLPEGVTR